MIVVPCRELLLGNVLRSNVSPCLYAKSGGRRRRVHLDYDCFKEGDHQVKREAESVGRKARQEIQFAKLAKKSSHLVSVF